MSAVLPSIDPSPHPPLRVVCALMANENGEYLIAQRPLQKSFPGLWEFPGGKIEPGETPEAALRREIQEELGVSILPLQILPSTHTQTDQGFIELIPIHARLIQGTPHNFEHLQISWVHPRDFEKFSWAPADLPILNSLRF